MKTNLREKAVVGLMCLLIACAAQVKLHLSLASFDLVFLAAATALAMLSGTYCVSVLQTVPNASKVFRPRMLFDSTIRFMNVNGRLIAFAACTALMWQLTANLLWPLHARLWWIAGLLATCWVYANLRPLGLRYIRRYIGRRWRRVWS